MESISNSIRQISPWKMWKFSAQNIDIQYSTRQKTTGPCMYNTAEKLNQAILRGSRSIEGKPLILVKRGL